jgi:hypothetical protein
MGISVTKSKLSDGTKGRNFPVPICEEGICQCPHIELRFVGSKITALVDIGAQASMSDAVCKETLANGTHTHEIPIVPTIYDSTICEKTRRIKRK